MTVEVANLLAKTFIARTDVKAIQFSGGYMPHVENSKEENSPRIPWSREALNDHLAGKRSYGHYMLNQDSECKLFAFDIDLNTIGQLPDTGYPEDPVFIEANLRTAWLDRANPGRYWMKLQFKLLANKLAKAIFEELEIPCAVAYSGSKGIHVYGLTGLISGHEARQGAQIVLDSIGEFELVRGSHLYKHKDASPLDGYPNLSIEVFPKQDSLDGKDLGNLLRLPLGRNLKNPKDPTFFIDMTTAIAEMKPVDPAYALSVGALNPWRRESE